MTDSTTLAGARRRLLSNVALERLSAAEVLQHAGEEGFRILAECAADPALDPEVRIAAASALSPPVPDELVERAARSLLVAEDPVLRARGYVLAGRTCLTSLRAVIVASLGDAGRFFELEVEVSLAKLAEAALQVLDAQSPDPAFPDWDRVASAHGWEPPLATPYLGLRKARLELEPARFGVTRTNFPHAVVGVLMDMGLPDGVYSVACWADGSTSTYLGDGNATEGFGDFPRVRAAAQRWLALAQSHFDRARTVADFPPAECDRVRFYLRGFDEIRSFDLDEASLMSDDHPLGPLYDEAHAVLTEVHAVERETRDES